MKSTCPGVSIMCRTCSTPSSPARPRHPDVLRLDRDAALALDVHPVEVLGAAPAAGRRTPVSRSIWSARVDLPWSMCAMMQKLRIRAGSVRPAGFCAVTVSLSKMGRRPAPDIASHVPMRARGARPAAAVVDEIGDRAPASAAHRRQLGRCAYDRSACSRRVPRARHVPEEGRPGQHLPRRGRLAAGRSASTPAAGRPRPRNCASWSRSLGGRYVVVELTDLAPVDAGVFFADGAAIWARTRTTTSRQPTSSAAERRSARTSTPGSSWSRSAPRPPDPARC